LVGRWVLCELFLRGYFMGKHLIFLIHGMGQYGAFDAAGTWTPDKDGWAKDATEALTDVYESCVAPIRSGATYGPWPKKFSERFEICPIYYDDIFQEYWAAWNKQAGSLTAALSAGGAIAPDAKKLAESFANVFGKDKTDAFQYTHLGDCVLYAAATVQQQIKTRVANAIVGKLSQQNFHQNYSGWSVIAHSLGTSVFHHTYAQLLNGLGASAGLLSGPTIVAMLANTAAVIPGTGTTYPASVQPVNADGFSPKIYLSAAHQNDIFTRLAPFNPGWSSSLDGPFINLSGLSRFLPQHSEFKKDAISIAGAAIAHGFRHYLYQPEVASTLFSALMITPTNGWEAKNIHTAVLQHNRDILTEQINARIVKTEEEIRDWVQSRFKPLENRLENAALRWARAAISAFGWA